MTVITITKQKGIQWEEKVWFDQMKKIILVKFLKEGLEYCYKRWILSSKQIQIDNCMNILKSVYHKNGNLCETYRWQEWPKEMQDSKNTVT